jgi:hypothetical protein
MKKFIENLKLQAAENPVLAIGVTAAVVTATAKLIDSASAAKGRRAYAKQVNYRVKNKK